MTVINLERLTRRIGVKVEPVASAEVRRNRALIQERRELERLRGLPVQGIGLIERIQEVRSALERLEGTLERRRTLGLGILRIPLPSVITQTAAPRE